MIFWAFKMNKLKKAFVEEVTIYAEHIRATKEQVGAQSFQFETRMTNFKKEVEYLQSKTRKEKKKAHLGWLILAIDEYILLSKYAKKTSIGSQKSRKKVEKHQRKALEYYQKFSTK